MEHIGGPQHDGGGLRHPITLTNGLKPHMALMPWMRPLAGACGIALGAFALLGQAPTATLTVTVQNVRSAEGQVRVAVYQEAQWLGQDPFARSWMPATGKALTATFALPPGEYAVAVLHDLNDNGEMDYRLMRLPKEPYGFSNDAKPRFGPPKFADAAFTLPKEGLDITIELRDWRHPPR